MIYVMISVATFIATIAVLTNVRKAKRCQQQMLHLINATVQPLRQLSSEIKHNHEIEQNTIKALNQICEALNKSFTTGASYMNNSGFALVNIAMCMIPFIDDIKECAIEEEDYEKAQECAKILQNLKQITKPISHD